MAAKRKLDMIVSEMSPSTNAVVHGVLVGLVSPVKESRSSGVKYFEGSISDGTKAARLVSFDATLRQEIAKAAEERTNVALSNCIVQTSKWTQELEVIANSRTKITMSPKKFRVDEATIPSAVPDKSAILLQSLSQLRDLAVGQLVSFRGKVVRVEESRVMFSKSKEKSLLKQDITVADGTGSARGVLWETHVGAFSVGEGYLFSTVRVNSFNGCKYFSLSESSTWEGKSDIGDVCVEDPQH